MPTAAPPLPRTIDEVIARLDAIVKECITRRDRAGYFPALYNRVTRAVRDAIGRREFDDNERMERLDVEFANRYLAAYGHYRAGELPTRSWLRAFTAAQSPGHIVLQHLLAGMNAHINLDLGIAAARIAPGAAFASLRRDFDRINTILATLTPVVEQEIDALSPVFKAVTALAPRLELKMVGFSMERARNEAWGFAQALAPLPAAGQVPRMGDRDPQVALLADVLLADGLVVRAIRACESTDVARNIEALASGEFAMRIHPIIGVPA
jgi:hypothetical protein